MSALENGNSSSASARTRKVAPLLAIGIFLVPYVFAWFILRKGYSTATRLVAFGWMVLMIVIMASINDSAGTPQSRADNRTPTQITTDALVNPQMNAITDKVARDAVDQYNIAETGGDKMQICVHAGFVAAAYLQAKDQSNYLKWNSIKAQDCAAAGVPGM